MKILPCVIPKAGARYRSGELACQPWSMVLCTQERKRMSQHPSIEWRNMYHWQAPFARFWFGIPTFEFRGEFRYKVYTFRVVEGKETQDFLLFCDPKSAGKGSAVELVTPVVPRLVPGILKWLHLEHGKAMRKWRCMHDD